MSGLKLSLAEYQEGEARLNRSFSDFLSIHQVAQIPGLSGVGAIASLPNFPEPTKVTGSDVLLYRVDDLLTWWLTLRPSE